MAYLFRDEHLSAQKCTEAKKELTIMQVLNGQTEPVGATWIREKTGMSNESVNRILRLLEKSDCVKRFWINKSMCTWKLL